MKKHLFILVIPVYLFASNFDLVNMWNVLFDEGGRVSLHLFLVQIFLVFDWTANLCSYFQK